MANQHKNPNRSYRPDPRDWADFADVARELGTSRQDLLDRYVAWALRRPGAELPPRPDPDPRE